MIRQPGFVHLTVSNRQHPGLELLRLSAKQVGMDPRVLGMGNTQRVGHGHGFGLKLTLMKKELDLLPPTQFVLFTDAFDVLLQPSQSLQALETFLLSNDNTVVFAAELSNWPDLVAYPTMKFPFPYLNSGVYAGRAKDILVLLQQPFDPRTDDQRYFVQQYLQQKDESSVKIHIDHAAEFFVCLESVPHSAILLDHKSSPTQNPVTIALPSATRSTQPFVLHLNHGRTRINLLKRLATTILGPGVDALAHDAVGQELWGLKYCLHKYRMKGNTLFFLAFVLIISVVFLRSCLGTSVFS